MNAIKFLLIEHKKIRVMLTQIKKSPNDATKRKKFAKHTTFIKHHEKMEQKIWYPYLRKNTTLSAIIKHLISEEKKAAKKIMQIKKVKPPIKWEDNFLLLKKSVEHHAGEEEKKLFPKVKKHIDNTDLKLIGLKMQKYKKSLDAATKR